MANNNHKTSDPSLKNVLYVVGGAFAVAGLLVFFIRYHGSGPTASESFGTEVFWVGGPIAIGAILFFLGYKSD